MGVFLSFVVSPSQIPEDQWEAAYEEALRIVDQSDLLDRVVLERNGNKYIAGRKTAEREFPQDGPGIYVCGTMASGSDMEDFYLYRRKPSCRNPIESGPGADILFYNWYPEDPELPTPSDICPIWGNKTQGRPGHIPLLAIACLFADRFLESVKISGDITAGQCRAAVRLANQSLEKPIQTPVTCRAEALAQRLQKLNLSTSKQLLAFFQLYLDQLTPETGKTLKKLFSAEALYQYFRSRMAQESLESGSLQELRNYLLMDLDLTSLLKMLVQDTLGPQLPLEEILSKLFEYKVHIPFENKNCVDPLGLDAAVDGDEEEPHDIEALMGRTFFSMLAGRNRNLPVYLPIQKIRDACRLAFPGEDTDALIDRLLAELKTDCRQEQVYGNGDNAIFSQLQAKAQEQWNNTLAYDLREPQDLRLWKPGLTIEPELENTLLAIMKKVRTFSTMQKYQEFLALDRDGRENYFFRHNRYVLIYEPVWDYIFSQIMNDAYIYRFFLLFKVDCSYKRIHDIMTPLLSNPPLIDMLWEQTSEEQAEMKN